MFPTSLAPQPVAPVSAYGPLQLQSLANMRQQQQSEQQQYDQAQAMNPLLLQREKLAAAAQQKQADDLAAENKIVAGVTQGATPQPAAAPASTAPQYTLTPTPEGLIRRGLPAAANTAAGPAPSSLQPASTLAATDPDTTPADLLSPAFSDPNATPASSVQPASTMANTAAPGAPPPGDTGAPAPTAAAQSDTVGSRQQQQDAEITRQMNAAGLGYRVPALMQSRAIARDNQIKAQEAQQDQDDQQIIKDAYNKSGGNLDTAAHYAQAAGISFKGLTALKSYQISLATNLLKQKEAQDDLGAKDFAQDQRNLETLRDHLDAFAKRPTDDSEDGQPAVWQQFLRDNADLMSAEHMTQTLQRHPGPPTADELSLYSKLLTTQAMATKDAANQAVITNAARGQRDDLITSLHGQTTPEGYQETLDASKIPHDDIPTADQMFDSGGKPIPQKFDMLDSMSLTAPQRSTARTAANNLAATQNYRMANLQYRAVAEADRARSQSEKDAIMAVANNAYANNGGDPDKAIAEIKASQDPTVQKNALGAITQINASKVSALKPTQTQAQIDQENAGTAAKKADTDAKNAKATAVTNRERAAWIHAHPGKTFADATDDVVKAARPTQATAATPATPAAATPAPPPPPAGKIRVKLNDGRTGSIDAGDFDAKTMTKLDK